MKIIFPIFLLFGMVSNFAMDRAGQSDQLYSSLITLINAREYEKAYTLFNSRTTKTMLYPEQIPALYAAINNSNLSATNRPFYDQISALISIYSDALKGTLAANEYVDYVFKNHK